MANPLVGTWKLNVAKSTYVTARTIREQTITIAEVADEMDVMATSTYIDGAILHIHYTVPVHGGQGTMIDGPFDAVFHKRVSPNEGETSYLHGGNVVLSNSHHVSADGQTQTVAFRGTDITSGQPIEGVRILEKQ
jgi:hypothetical protein